MSIVQRQHTYEKVILSVQLIGFAAVIAVLWLDEYVDVPYYLFHAAKTPLRPSEFLFEAVTVVLVGIAVVVATLWAFQRLRFLENFIQVCAWCRKVNLDGGWISFEQYLKREHEVQSTHSICPTCRAEATSRK